MTGDDRHERSVQIDVDSLGYMQLDWHPDQGKYVSMPAKEPLGTTALTDRLRWGRTPAATLSGAHADVATHSFFSPNGALLPCATSRRSFRLLLLQNLQHSLLCNVRSCRQWHRVCRRHLPEWRLICLIRAGRYIATTSLDSHLVVWDLATNEPSVIIKHKLPSIACTGAWHPCANELMLALEDGQVMTWTSVVPKDKLEPQVPIPSASLLPGAQPLRTAGQFS
jgi:WD40 repeat protein